MIFFCAGVVYSGEYDVCDVTLSVYPHRASLKNMPDHGGNRTYDLWNTSPMLCQLSYAVRTVRVSDISEQHTDIGETKSNVPFVQQNTNIIALKLLMYKELIPQNGGAKLKNSLGKVQNWNGTISF